MTLWLIKFGVFVLASLSLGYLSRASLRRRDAHGRYRFLAWEAILIVVLLNVEDWFVAPFAPHQLLAWALLAISLFLVLHGLRLLRTVGRPDQARADTTLLPLEQTTQLVTVGAYRYIRHPLYSSLLFLVWGACCKHLTWAAIGMALLATIFLTMTAQVEEDENLRYFGPAYQTYMQRTRRFIPWVF